MDSSIAWTWHEETGDKVWVVNAAHSGSSIRTWLPGSVETDNDFWQAVNLANACLDVLESEIQAGHYTFSQMGYYWFQGCANESSKSASELMNSQQYTEAYCGFHKAFCDKVSKDLNADGTNEAPSFGGILMVHNPITFLTPVDCLLSGVRTSQFYMGASAEDDFKNVFVVSVMPNVWTGDNRVEEYFKALYPDGNLPYPTRTTYPMPTTVSEVHPDIHYRQPGYNEMGHRAVLATIACIAGRAGVGNVKILQENGYLGYQNNATVSLKPGESMNFAVLSEPLYLLAKGVTVEVDCVGVTCEYFSLTATETAAVGTKGTVRILLGGKLVMTLNIQIQ